jgi:hypothetical protein
LPCLKCNHCGRTASKDQLSPDSPSSKEEVWVKDFVWAETDPDDRTGGGATFCKECARRDRGGSLEDTTDGFEYVTRLEQYAFLLCVALNKLYGRLKQRGVVPACESKSSLPICESITLTRVRLTQTTSNLKEANGHCTTRIETRTISNV